MATALNAALMVELSQLIARHMGLHFPEDRWPELARGLKSAGAELGFDESSQALRWLKTGTLSTHQLETLASHLTIGETYFFRDPKSFEVLERELLPPVLARRAAGGRTLRMWSAGCCTGEEAYSLAITCARVLPEPEGWNVSILATDLNPRFLEKAEAGVYSDWSFRGASPGLRERHFTALPGKKFAVDAALKRLIHFGYLNLAEDVYPSLANHTNAMDVIFCRNVLMYFTPEHQRRVVENLHRCLVEDGCLLVNPAEASTSLFPMFTMEDHGGVLLFRKSSRAGRAVKATSPAPELPAAGPVLSAPQPEVAWAQAAATLPAAAAGGAAASSSSAAFVPSATYDPSAWSTPFGASASCAPSAASSSSASPSASFAALGPTPSHGPPAPSAPSPSPVDALARARALADDGRLEEAMAACRHAVAAERTNLAAHFLLATICEELGRLEEAAAELRRVLYLDQDFVLAHHAMAGLSRRLGKARDAARHRDIALRLLSGRPRDELVPESGGVTCGRLAESVRAMGAVTA